MALETGTHIDDLVATNPASGDELHTVDDHIRLIKGRPEGESSQD